MDDGYSIQALVLGLFGEYMPHMIEQERLYILIPPLYKQDGKYFYEHNENELNRKKHFDRFKGLGAMDVEDVAETITGPNALVKKVTLEDLEYAKSILTTTSAKYKLMKDAGIM